VTWIISDRLKSCLPNGPLQYVLSLECDAWFSPDRVATLADTYVNNRPMYSVPNATAAKVASTATNVCQVSCSLKIIKRTVTVIKVAM